jgi:hypothetical protein
VRVHPARAEATTQISVGGVKTWYRRAARLGDSIIATYDLQCDVRRGTRVGRQGFTSIRRSRRLRGLSRRPIPRGLASAKGANHRQLSLCALGYRPANNLASLDDADLERPCVYFVGHLMVFDLEGEVASGTFTMRRRADVAGNLPALAAIDRLFARRLGSVVLRATRRAGNKPSKGRMSGADTGNAMKDGLVCSAGLVRDQRHRARAASLP